MQFDPVLVTRDDSEGAPSIRVEANRPYVLMATVILLAILVLPIVFQEQLPIAVVIVAIIMLLFDGFRFVILIGPARLLGRPWVAADGNGISARNRRGIVRYGWERVVSVTWNLTGLGLARWTVVEVTPSWAIPSPRTARSTQTRSQISGSSAASDGPPGSGETSSRCASTKGAKRDCSMG